MTAIPAIRTAAVESWEDHVEAWHHLGRQVDGAAWGRAAIAASLKGRYGEDAVGRFAAEVGFSVASVYDFARTFGVFPEKSDRSETLTFSHYVHAVHFTRTAEDARAAVAEAEREGWSANALRAHLRAPALPPDHLAEAVLRTVSAEAGACGPVTADAKAGHIWAFVENLHAIKDYELKPLIQSGTKKSLRELARKVQLVQEWLALLQTEIKEKIK